MKEVSTSKVSNDPKLSPVNKSTHKQVDSSFRGRGEEFIRQVGSHPTGLGYLGPVYSSWVGRVYSSGSNVQELRIERSMNSSSNTREN